MTALWWFDPDNIRTQELGDAENSGVRASLRFVPNDAVTIDFAFAHMRDEGNGPALKVTNWNLNARRGEGEPCQILANAVSARAARRPRGGVCTIERARDSALNGVAGSNPALAEVINQLYTVRSGDNTAGGVANSEEIKTDIASLEIAWDISDRLTLESRTAMLSIEHVFENDNDYTPVIWRERVRSAENDSISQELLLRGEFDRFHWTGGIYYFEESPEEHTTGSDSGTPNVFIRRETLDAESFAVFFEGSLDVTERLGLTLGVRHTEDEKSLTAFGDEAIRSRDRNFDPMSDPDIVALIDGSGIPSSATGDGEWSETTWRASVQYHWTDQVMTYFTASSGFTSGGFNNELELKFGPSENFGVLPFDAEVVDLVEIGLRSRFLDDRLTLNATYFEQEWTDRQLRKIQPDGTRFVTNAGDAETSGAEIEIVFRATDSLSISGAYGLLDGEWTSIDPAAAADVLIDSVLARQPDSNWSLEVDHVAEIWNGTLNTTLAYGWRDEQYSGDTEVRKLILDSYGLLNARVQYVNADDTWSVSLGCRNCADESYSRSGVDFTGLTENQARVRDFGREGYRVEELGRPSEWFVEVTRRF